MRAFGVVAVDPYRGRCTSKRYANLCSGMGDAGWGEVPLWHRREAGRRAG